MTSSQTNTTVDHDEISRWAESTSAARLGFAVPTGDTGVLRIDLPGGAGAQGLEPISWTSGP